MRSELLAVSESRPKILPLRSHHEQQRSRRKWGDQQFQRISSRLKPSGLVEITGRVLGQSCAGENQRRQKKRLFLPVESTEVDSKPNYFEWRDSASFSAPAVSGDVDASEEEFNNSSDELKLTKRGGLDDNKLGGTSREV